MRKRAVVLAVAVLVVLGLTAVDAHAGKIRMIGEGDHRSGSGGEFTVLDYQDGSGTELPVVPMGPGMLSSYSGARFQTFCVEKTQSMSLGTTYDFAINTFSDAGSGSSGIRALQSETAWLYTQFYRGALIGYEKTPGLGRAADAKELQDLIWHYQDSAWALSSFTTQQQGWVDAMNNDSSWSLTSGDIGGVRILNLTKVVDGEVKYFQDQMVMVPLPAASLAGLGLLAGLGAIGYVRRRARVRVM